MNVTFRTFHESDIPLLTEIMTRAFNEDSVLHLGRNAGPDGYDDGSFLRRFALHPDSDAYVVLGDGTPIGAVIVWINRQTHENFLGCVFTEPSLHSCGIGLQIWRQIEEAYPDTRIWRTETPLHSTRNLHFYINKCGFMGYKIDDPKQRDEAQVQLIKFMVRP